MDFLNTLPWRGLFDGLSIAFILVGAFLCLSAALGLVRFHDTMARLHAITKPQSLGIVFTLVGVALRVTASPTFGPAERGDLGICALIIMFTLLTAPTVGQRQGRITRREELYDPEHLSRNDLKQKAPKKKKDPSKDDPAKLGERKKAREAEEKRQRRAAAEEAHKEIQIRHNEKGEAETVSEDS
ncbi:MAG: monovalent cation/H(+) antiporter subunit G [Corynebacterium glucuronolyticum]|nr:monovalent cation/H(+) antiporter subunit G [Mycobacteriaceae bacterium]MDY5834366.1 monovalent cation/H(+) antiporter subunit G [Corynebacterium glucuronolyticum]